MSSPAASLCTLGAFVWPYYGPLFLGGVGATFLSGMAAIQAVIYLKLYPKDSKYLKAFVFTIWAVDIAQTGLTWNALWFYLVRNFGDTTGLDEIPMTLTMVAILGWITVMLVQSFYLYRIFGLSNRNFLVVVPIGILMVLRLSWVIGGSVEMVNIRKFSFLMSQHKWLSTLGLSFSIAVDITITMTLAILLWNRSQSLLMLTEQVMASSTTVDGILDSLVLYTLELGSVTGFVSILAFTCWFVLGDHMVLIGLYISYVKLYANCLMATLNMRYSFRRRRMMNEVSIQDHRPCSPHAIPESSLSSSVRFGHVRTDISKDSQYDADGSRLKGSL